MVHRSSHRTRSGAGAWSGRGEPTVISGDDPAAAWAERTAEGRFGYAIDLMVETPGGVATGAEASHARFAAEVDGGRATLARAGYWHGS